MKFRSLAVGLIASLGLASSASAIAMFDAEAESTFTLIDADGMSITFETGPGMTETPTTGTGIATIDDDDQTPSGMGAFSTITQISEVSGSAAAPGGTSMATVMNGVLIILDNSAGSTDATAEFEFTYEWTSLVSKTDGWREAAGAVPFFHLTGFAPSGEETLMIDDSMGGGPVPVVDFLLDFGAGLTFSDPSVGTGGTAAPVTVTALVTVPAGRIDSFSVINDAFGFAVHRGVPEPVTAALTMMSLGALGMATRRRAA